MANGITTFGNEASGGNAGTAVDSSIKAGQEGRARVSNLSAAAQPEVKSADALKAEAKEAAEKSLPAGFSGKIRREAVVSDPDSGKDVTFRKGEEALLFDHLTRHREKLPHAYEELVTMRAIHGEWKLQFAKPVK